MAKAMAAWKLMSFRFLLLINYLLSAPVASAVVTAAAPPRKNNNLLVILTDQQRYDTLRFVQEERGVPEKARIRTPNLDRIAREGAYFRNAYTHCAVCGPARAGFMFGRTIENTGIRTNNMAKDENLPGSDAEHKLANLLTYDEILVKEHDYVAEYYGKWHLPNSKGLIYDNDVRRASGRSSWFGKYNADDGSKHESYGMTEWYRRWLSSQPNATLAASSPQEKGDQRNQFSRYYFRPDPLDKMYGLPSDSDYDGKYKQSDQHGMNRLPHSLSVTAQQTLDALEALERLATGDKPFSLHLSLHSPHPPMIVTEKYYDMYDPNDLEPPISLDDDMSNSAYSRNNKLGEEYRNPSSLRRWLANYYGLITEIDDWVGRLLDKMDELGIADKTLLAFSSDHGEMLGAHAMRDKNTFYEESSHVPLLLWGPGLIQPGTIVDDPVSHLDLHSTFLDYLVGRNDYRTDGNTLRDVMVVDGDPGRDSFVVTMRNWTEAAYNYKPPSGPAFMIRKGPWKLIYAGQANNKDVDMLYNLDDDPAEMNNLIGLNGDTAPDSVVGKAEHLKAMLVRYLKTSQHPATQNLEMRRTWRDMKYWCGDSVIDFSAGRTGTKYLYMGAPVGTRISISMKDDAVGRFGLKLEESLADLYEDKGVVIITIRHFGGGPVYEMIGEPSAALSIVYGSASPYEEKQVKLVPPVTDSTPSDEGIIASKDFKNQLDFILSEQQEQKPDITTVTIGPKAPTYKSTPIPTTMQCLGSSLDPTSKFDAGDFICSPNSQYKFGLASDGDLSLWHRETKIWSAGTCCVGSDTYALLQSRGNLVVYTYVEEDSEDDALTKTFLWASKTGQNPSSVLIIDDDASVQIRTPSGEILWSIGEDKGLFVEGMASSANVVGLNAAAGYPDDLSRGHTTSKGLATSSGTAQSVSPPPKSKFLSLCFVCCFIAWAFIF